MCQRLRLSLQTYSTRNQGLRLLRKVGLAVPEPSSISTVPMPRNASRDAKCRLAGVTGAPVLIVMFWSVRKLRR